jgi:1-acyl-sn-glycerol-3-phosphate acyltransferase
MCLSNQDKFLIIYTRNQLSTHQLKHVSTYPDRSMKFIWRLFLKLIGWKTDLVFPYHHVRKYIVLIGPHTSNWDFLIGLAYRSILGMSKARFLGKKELFKPPFGFIFYALGGTPVDRTSKHNMVDEVAALFNKHDDFALALSPEGTRKKVDKLKSGFYYIAKQAQVPFVLAGLDYKLKQVVFSELMYTTDSKANDFARVLAFYRRIEAKIPDQSMKHL